MPLSQMKQTRNENFGKQNEDLWTELSIRKGNIFEWDTGSTSIREPPFFKENDAKPRPVRDILEARVLVVAGDSVSTEHISPTGNIEVNSPAGRYLMDKGLHPKEFNAYGSRQGNHEVMVRATFAHGRFQNLLVPGEQGGWTLHLPDEQTMTIFDAAMRYKASEIPLLVLAGKEYGMGSPRDWAAKGTLLLGVKAVLAESYGRVHRCSLISLGILPLQFFPGQNPKILGLTGKEKFSILGLAHGLRPGKELSVIAQTEKGRTVSFSVITRLDAATEVDCYRNGGIHQTLLQKALEAPCPGVNTAI